MLTKLLQSNSEQIKPKEGDLYKEVIVGGRLFRLYYGYYEENDRNSMFNDPIPIYPDLLKNPEYTDEGTLIVTAMQDVCARYLGMQSGDSCTECVYFQSDAELFGLCKCLENQNTTDKKINDN